MILDRIVEDKKIRLKEHKSNVSFEEIRKLAEAELKDEKRPKNCFYENLRKQGISIIGEFKKASPSLGRIESKIDLLEG